MKAPYANRIAAKVIDLLIVSILGAAFPYIVGPLAGFFYSLFADGMPFENWKGQSVGKKILGLVVVSTESGKPIEFKDSAIRNAPVGLATFFAIIPIWGWIILFLLGLPLLAMEIYLMIRMETGHRLGDVMADTEVKVKSTIGKAGGTGGADTDRKTETKTQSQSQKSESQSTDSKKQDGNIEAGEEANSEKHKNTPDAGSPTDGQ